MSRLTLTQLKQYLKERPSSELVNEIGELFKRFPSVRDYFESKVIVGGSGRLLDQYKKVIEDEFFPSNGLGRGRLSIPRQAINEYKKVSSTVEHTVNLMLFAVETGIEYTITFGDMDESYYRGFVRIYARALDMISNNGLDAEFSARSLKIVESTLEIGWGVHDNLQEIYFQHF